MIDTQIKRVMETDGKGVKRQIYPITHVSAVEGFDKINNGSLSSVNSINGKTGDVTLTLSDLGLSKEMLNKINQLLSAFEHGALGNCNIELEKIEEE